MAAQLYPFLAFLYLILSLMIAPGLHTHNLSTS